MEDTKKGEEKRECGQSCVDMHKLCAHRFCWMRVLLIALVLIVVFSLGCAFGTHHEGRSHYRKGEVQMHRGMMNTSRGSQNIYGVHYENVPNLRDGRAGTQGAGMMDGQQGIRNQKSVQTPTQTEGTQVPVVEPVTPI